MMKKSQPILDKLNSFIRKLKIHIPAAKLAKLKNLTEKSANITRLSAIAEMLRRYVEIAESVDRLEIEGIYLLIPDRRKKKVHEELSTAFSKLDNVTKNLQQNSTTLSEVRVLFDGVISTYPNMKSRIGSSARVIGDPNFETGIVKIQEYRFTDMDENRISATECLERFDNDAEETTGN